jgi:DNA-binding transcriptional LysR family regulator
MRALAGPRFEQYAVLIQAACAGLGVALVPAFLIHDVLNTGVLVQPIDAPVEVGDQGHYLCYSADRLAAKPGLQRFRTWMIGECGR